MFNGQRNWLFFFCFQCLFRLKRVFGNVKNDEREWERRKKNFGFFSGRCLAQVLPVRVGFPAYETHATHAKAD